MTETEVTVVGEERPGSRDITIFDFHPAGLHLCMFDIEIVLKSTTAIGIDRASRVFTSKQEFKIPQPYAYVTLPCMQKRGQFRSYPSWTLLVQGDRLNSDSVIQCLKPTNCLQRVAAVKVNLFEV
jgi:hypothetical protein